MIFKIFSKSPDSSRRHFTSLAFTLAEVLITLGIIGIVAELTIPTLINSFEKQVVVVSLQKFYSNMSQAIKLSEITNGQTSQWVYPAQYDPVTTKQWFDTYLAPYIKYNTIESQASNIRVKFDDGTFVEIDNHGMPMTMHFEYYINSKTDIMGKNHFVFWMGPGTTKPYLFCPYGMGASWFAQTRATWLSQVSYGCSKTTGRQMCATLIMNDGWQIFSDYPFFN